METITKSFGLLEGAQTHESSDDVELTVKLAEYLAHRYKIDVRKYNGYEAGTFERSGKILNTVWPNYDLSSPEQFDSTPHILLQANHRYTLWVNLQKFKEEPDRSAIRWVKKGTGPFFIHPTDPFEERPEWKELAVKAKKELSGYNLSNFFSRSTCDIDQDIYRLDFDALDALSSAIWHGDPRAL